MKLLLITAIEEFDHQVKQILKLAGVKAFTAQTINGYKNANQGEVHTWFVSDDVAIPSVLYTVFASNDCVSKIMEKTQTFNEEQESESRLHLAIVGLEKMIS
jgi:nitrogen regulatory protein PII